MACINMYNNDQQGLYTIMGPRISFSNDFVDTQQPSLRHDNGYKEAPVSSDFEFSVPGYNMIFADEVFSKGKLLPLKENCTKITTLKDELLVDDNDDGFFPRMGKGMSRWKELLGLKKSHNLPHKVVDKCVGDLGRIDETKTSDFCKGKVFANIRGAN